MRVNEYTEIRKELTKIHRLFNKEIPMCKITPKLSMPWSRTNRKSTQNTRIHSLKDATYNSNRSNAVSGPCNVKSLKYPSYSRQIKKCVDPFFLRRNTLSSSRQQRTTEAVKGRLSNGEARHLLWWTVSMSENMLWHNSSRCLFMSCAVEGFNPSVPRKWTRTISQWDLHSFGTKLPFKKSLGWLSNYKAVCFVKRRKPS